LVTESGPLGGGQFEEPERSVRSIPAVAAPLNTPPCGTASTSSCSSRRTGFTGRACLDGCSGRWLGSAPGTARRGPTGVHTWRYERDRGSLGCLGADDELGDEGGGGAVPDGAHPWRPNWVTKRFIATRTAAGVDHFRLHDLRHFMATEMLNKHVPLPTVSGRLAHARMSTTLNVYAHAVPNGGLAEKTKRSRSTGPDAAR
jgi:Phage integrase family